MPYSTVPAVRHSLLLTIAIVMASGSSLIQAKPTSLQKTSPGKCRILNQALGKNTVLRDLSLQSTTFKDVVAIDQETGELFFNAAIHNPDDSDHLQDINIAGWLNTSHFRRYLPPVPYIGLLTNSWIGSSSNPLLVYGYVQPVNRSHVNSSNTFSFAYDPVSKSATPLKHQPEIHPYDTYDTPVGMHVRSSDNGAYTVLHHDPSTNKGIRNDVVATVYHHLTEVAPLHLDMSGPKNLNGLAFNSTVRGISDDGNIILMNIASRGQFGRGNDIGLYVHSESQYQLYIESVLGKHSSIKATVYKDEGYYLYVLTTAGTPLGLSPDGKTMQYMDRELNIYRVSIDDALKGNMAVTLIARYDSKVPTYKCTFETTPDMEGGYSYCNSLYTNPNDPDLPIQPSSSVWGDINKIDKSIPFIDYMNKFFQETLFRDVFEDGNTASLWQFKYDRILGRVTIGTLYKDYGGSDVVPHLFYCDLK